MRPLVTRLVLVVAFGCTLSVFWALLENQLPVHAQGTEGARTAAPQLEEIYIGRSVRESRIAPTEFCAQVRSGFGDALFEDHYTFRSTATRSSDGRMVNMNVRTIGSLHACFGRTSDPAIVNFYGEGVLGGAAFTGTGECRGNADFPEKGLLVAKCFLGLSGLPDRYVGGLLTTNSMSSLKTLGLETDPRGYTQSSIATIRLWKKR
jgi:hypothetical protein